MQLHEHRLGTTDATGRRLFLYPAPSRGVYQRRKRWVHALLMLLFLALPWIYVNGTQLVLLDLAKREFFLFGLHLRAHDAPLLVFVLLTFTFAIGLVSAIWGRVWCGWACPQTVFVDFAFRRLESWVEGSHRERRERDNGPWTSEKIRIKFIKWFLFSVVALIFTHSLLAYFVGSRELLGIVSSSPLENWGSFLAILITTGIVLFDFGWFREQFCVIVCPYGRFQSVMLDSNSLVVAYDEKRGEPRRGLSIPQGDCVNCLRCVQVCPTGIDIRRGLQMECVACAACVDACDEVMTKIKKPKGLIRYTTLAELKGFKKILLRPRTIAYVLLLSLSAGGLALTLGRTDFLEATLLRAKDAPYQTVETPAGKLVVNHFRIDLSNQTGTDHKLSFELVDKNLTLVMPMNPLLLKDRAAQAVDFFVQAPESSLTRGAYKTKIRLNYGTESRELEVTLVGPGA